MQVIDQINGSALFAQSAYSASIATKDSLGRDITTTYLTGIDLSNYYTKDETSGKEELANAFANIPVGDPEVNAYVTSNSASIDESTDLVQSNSSTWNDVTAYQSNSANYLTAINIPESATWNDISETVQTNSAQWSQGGTTYTSPSGTILINGDTLEGTNSAISIVGYEGFVSSYGSRPAGPNDTARYTWDKALPNTIITLDTRVNSRTLYWSANTDLTGETVLPETGITTLSISIPNATAFATWSNKYFNLNGATVSAADTLGTTVGELAWASALPTYEYDNTNKISAINGSALAGGNMFTSYLEYNDQNQISGYAGSAFAGQGGGGNPEVENYVQTNSGTIDDTVTSYQTNSGTFLTAHQAISANEWNGCYDNVTTNSGAWGGSALPISAGPGVKLQLVNNTLVVSNDETVLYSDLTGRPVSPGQSITLSESPLNFDKVAIYLNGSIPTGTINVANGYEEVPFEQISSSNTLQFMKAFCGSLGNQDATFEMGCGYSGTSGLTWTKWYGYAKSVLTNEAEFDNPIHLNIWKVVGINRK